MPVQTIALALAALLRAAALPAAGRRPEARDPRTPLAFPHGRLAILLVAVAMLSLTGFAHAPAARPPAAAAQAAGTHPNALCFGRLDMREELAPFATDRWEICYRRGLDVARLRIRGDGATDFDCVVYAPDGRVVAHDDAVHDVCKLDWRVRVTGNHRVEVHNLGDVANRYALVTR